jgi:hypothetical protein
MRRLNVRRAQIDECIESSMFALSALPSPELQKGEPLLLQLVKQDAGKLAKIHSRIDFVLIFDYLERDFDGSISRAHWPAEGRTWRWIVYGAATVPTIPFSLEELPLAHAYDGQDNARYIDPADERLILPFIQWSLAKSPQRDLQIIAPDGVAKEFGTLRTLSGIYNHDRIAILSPPTTRTVSVEQFERNPWLAETLKSYYNHHCQVCDQDFKPRYGVAMADSHHIQYLRNGGPDISGNIVVLCPNHHRVVHATDARFDRSTQTYIYPNGLREPLVLPDHLLKAPLDRSDLITL